MGIGVGLAGLSDLLKKRKQKEGNEDSSASQSDISSSTGTPLGNSKNNIEEVEEQTIVLPPKSTKMQEVESRIEQYADQLPPYNDANIVDNNNNSINMNQNNDDDNDWS